MTLEDKINNLEELEKKNRSSKDTKSLFLEFPAYTKETVLWVIKRLRVSQRRVLYLMYGRELNNLREDVSDTELKYFELEIKPRIIYLLNNFKVLRKTRTIYQCYWEYSKEQINEVIRKLDDGDLYYVRKKYGPDFEEVFVNSLNEKENNYYYNRVRYRIKKLLQNIDKESIDMQINALVIKISSVFDNMVTNQEFINRLSKEEYTVIHYCYVSSLLTKLDIEEVFKRFSMNEKDILLLFRDVLTLYETLPEQIKLVRK